MINEEEGHREWLADMMVLMLEKVLNLEWTKDIDMYAFTEIGTFFIKIVQTIENT